jgi:hypothetical protein
MGHNKLANVKRQVGSLCFCFGLMPLLPLPAFTLEKAGRSSHEMKRPSDALHFPIAVVNPTREYSRLIGKLRARRANVKSTKEKVWQPFFSVSGRIMKVNNGAIQVFEYSTPAATQSQANRVSPDGKTIGNSKPSWMSTPHFFKSPKLIVIYVGDDQTILRILQAELGHQFAGG